MQSSFKIDKKIIIEDRNEKWNKLKKELKIIYENFEQGKIVNSISNKALLRKILKRMAQLEGGPK